MKQRIKISQQFGKAGERGAVLVEIAMVLPLLAIVFLIIINLGLLIREHQLLQNAAREGARFSALPANRIFLLNPSATPTKIKQRVIDYCQQEKITVNEADITINQAYPIPMGGGLTSMGSEITVTYARAPLIPGVPFLPGGPLTLTGRSVFRNLY